MNTLRWIVFVILLVFPHTRAVADPTPPSRTPGVFNGLALDPQAPAHENAGFVTLKLTAAGNYSGKAVIAGRKLAGAGSFDLSGRSVLRFNAGRTTEAVLDLELDESGSTISGTLARSNNPTVVPVLLRRAAFDRTTPATNFAGLYTLAIAPSTNALFEIGDGFGTATVDANGSLSLTTLLADVTPASQKVGISAGGEWPLYVSLYGGKGSILGWIQIDPNASQNAVVSPGGLHWTRPAQARKPYTEGFTNAFFTLGSPYVPPGTNQVLEMAEGVVILVGGDVNGFLMQDLRLESNNKVTNLGSDPLALVINTAKGRFKGTLKPEGGRTLSLQGVILPNLNQGDGFFRGTNSTGNVYFGQ